MTDHEAKAKALLPCVCKDNMYKVRGSHLDLCPAYYRPAVAAALGEAHSLSKKTKQQAAMWQEFYTFDPRADTIERIVELKDQAREREAELAQLRAKFAEAERITLGYVRHLHKAESERNAAYVKGLERAREIASICSGTAATAMNWIQAEIDKGTNK